MRGQVISGIRPRFQGLSQSAGQISHVLLTRSPLIHPKASSFDLHVLSTPPAFVLSQDQTLRECLPVIGPNTRVERHDNHRNRVATCTASSLCLTSKGISNPDQRPRPGMSTYLALTFGTLLSSQGTDTVFKPLSQALRVFRSVLRFVLHSAYQIRRSAFPTRFPAAVPPTLAGLPHHLASSALRRNRPDGLSDVLNFSPAPPRKANPTPLTSIPAQQNSTPATVRRKAVDCRERCFGGVATPGPSVQSARPVLPGRQLEEH